MPTSLRALWALKAHLELHVLIPLSEPACLSSTSSCSLAPSEPQEAEAVMSFAAIPLSLTAHSPSFDPIAGCYIQQSLGKICVIMSYFFFILKLESSDAKSYVLLIVWNLHFNVALKKCSSPVLSEEIRIDSKEVRQRAQEKYAKHCLSRFFFSDLISWTTCMWPTG